MSNEGAVNNETMINWNLSYASMLGFKILERYNVNSDVLNIIVK